MFNFSLPIYAMHGKVDTGKNICEQYIYFRILLPFINAYQ